MFTFVSWDVDAHSPATEDGANHLGGAWLAAGASAVVLSPAELDVEATLEAMLALHDPLARGEGTPAEALRRARVALAKDARFGHGRYDAALQLHGLGHRAAGGR